MKQHFSPTAHVLLFSTEGMMASSDDVAVGGHNSSESEPPIGTINESQGKSHGGLWSNL